MSKTYNKKAFLLPDSINSCANFHAKIFEDGRYVFRIHDCITGIRLKGDLTTEQGAKDAIEKMRTLLIGLEGCMDFIYDNYLSNKYIENETN